MAGRERHAGGMNPLGVEIAAWMKRRGITSSRELARKADVSPRTIDRWLRPGFEMQREPAADVLEKVAGALSMPMPLLQRRVAESRGYQGADGLTESQASVVALMGPLPGPVQESVLDVVASFVEGVHRSVEATRSGYGADAAIKRIESERVLSNRQRERLREVVQADVDARGTTGAEGEMVPDADMDAVERDLESQLSDEDLEMPEERPRRRRR
jgi:transcriptional regulator with XRE-family HTH domain